MTSKFLEIGKNSHFRNTPFLFRVTIGNVIPEVISQPMGLAWQTVYIPKLIYSYSNGISP